ncbi:MAG: hypothetical protein ACRBCT_02915 [Alphaproteobacteria bacterium]
MKKFLITLGVVFLTPIILFYVLFAAFRLVDLIETRDFERNLNNNNYEEICIAHSYSVRTSDENSITFEDRVVQLDNWNAMSADDAAWVIIGLKADGQKEVYLLGKATAEKHFKQTDKNFCIKTTKKD